jgi:hypothetical protein
MDDLHAGGRYYPVVTEEYPHGMSCPVCERVIELGQPFAQVPIAWDLADGDSVVIDVCVYCTGTPGRG